MDLRKFEYLKTIAEEKTLSQAAQKLYVSQPSLSQFLSKTEQTLGTKLFKRINQELIPTKAGTIYINTAYELLALHKNALLQLQELSQNHHGELSIGMTPERSVNSLHSIYVPFHRKYPNVRLHFFEEFPSQLVEMTQRGQLDFAIISDYTKRAGFEYIPLCSNVMVLFINKDNPIIADIKYPTDGTIPYIDMERLKNCEFMGSKINTQSRRIYDNVFTETSYYPQVVFETNSAQTSLNMVSVSNVIALMPSAYAFPNQTQLRHFRVPRNPTWNICAACKQGKYLGSITNDLISIIKKHLNETIMIKT